MSQEILMIGDDSAVGASFEQSLARDGHQVHFCRDPAAALGAAAAGRFDLILVSQTTPQLDALEILRQLRSADVQAGVVILTRHPTVETAVAAVREGAADYLREPCSAEELRALVRRMEPSAPAGPPCPPAEFDAHRPQEFEGMLGRCQAMGDVFALVRRIAPADSTVLVTGESGTGKGVLSRMCG